MKTIPQRTTAVLFGLLMACATAWGASRGDSYDVLTLPAMESPRATQAKLFGVGRAGDRLVVVGQRGFILYSDDFGANWTQASVPVRADLLDVHFPSAQQGWAVGHDGVILHSSDAGATWVKQLDGYQASDIGLAYYRDLLKKHPDDETYQILVGEFEFAEAQGADRAFFKVYFGNEQLGYAIGAYGMVFRTLDGGASWEPTMHDVKNDGFRHVFDYAIGNKGVRYVSGEMGQVWISRKVGGYGRTVIPFYDGSFFTIISTDDGELLVAGLRGNAFHSSDEGDTWQPVELPTHASIFGSTRLQDGRLVLVSQAGEVLVSEDHGTRFVKTGAKQPFALSDVEEGKPGQLILVGLGGVRTVTLASGNK